VEPAIGGIYLRCRKDIVNSFFRSAYHQHISIYQNMIDILN
jgi:hypothetical protein